MIIIKKQRFFILPVFILLAAGILFFNRAKTHERTIYGAFDTICRMSVYSQADNTAEYEELIRSLDAQLSPYRGNSAIYALNNGEECTLSPELTEFLCTAVSYTNMIPDYFDITINPVCESWQKAGDDGVLPDDIDAKLALVGTDCIYIDIDKNTARLTEEGASVTLGAIAKGYAADRLVSAMLSNGEQNALIDLGGNIYALGSKPDGSSWTVGISDPKDTSANAVTLEAADTAIVTSGDYQRYFELNGKRYHHIIDPKTGYPAESGLRSATAVGKDATVCDVLSTAMFVAGIDGAKELCKRFSIDAVLITDDTVYYSAALENKITYRSELYRFECLN